MKNKDYYLGLDIGSNSVGYAVTDLEYNLQKFKGNLMWGVNLFDEANHAQERRGYRTTRRRYARRRQRINLLQELIAPAIIEKDPDFFMRLRESGLFPEDAKHRTGSILFNDEGYTDKDYFEQYPTIHHLICDLMENDTPHDIRLVYLACACILKHRGHFLIDVGVDNIAKVRDFSSVFENFKLWFEDAKVAIPFDCSAEDFGNILKQKTGITAKERAFKDLLFGGSTPQQDSDEDFPVNLTKLLKLICGGKSNLSDIFIQKKEAYKELEYNSICVASPDFDDKLEVLYTQLEDGDAELIASVKNMYDWSLLEDILSGNDSISKAKVAVYEEHKKDLAGLKYFIKNYLTRKEYTEIFTEVGDKQNYVSYTYNLKGAEPNKFPKAHCNQEDFNKFIKKYIAQINPSNEDAEEFERLKSKAEKGTLCPKQVTGDNRVIPYQLYYAELKAILHNAKKYTPILNVSDDYGTVEDKILSIMQFRIPYYVGPLVKIEGKNSHAWIERKAEGKIYPWNFNEKVDLNESENAFIRRMTCKCSYMAGEDVLPKNSLLYSKFCVLNEINNITIDENKISSELKQKIYEELFLKKCRKVTKKGIKKFLLSIGEVTDEQKIGGIDDVVKSSLKSYHDFRNLLIDKKLTEKDAEEIIERITATTDRRRLENWLKENYPGISQDDVKYISKLKYKDYGRLSRKLLCGITNYDLKTGEITDDTIISMLWDTQNNLMQLLGGDFGFDKIIENHNCDYYKNNPKSISEKMSEMYLSPGVRRSVIRTLDIAKEIKTITGCEPKKIFVEMTRGEANDSKQGRTKSRREQISEYLESMRGFANDPEINNLQSELLDFDDSKLRSTKYYLYFIQLGRCMYSGEAINLAQVNDEHIYNIDHIFPQSKIKDDSLDNRVLVKSTLNGEKGDTYPISSDIRKKMFPFWQNLRAKNLISEKKFSRLTRSEPFSDAELAGFINRQLVETSQASKAVAQLLSDIFPNSDIVYVKARNVSEFKNLYDFKKCREINDLHHAKDAYINIVAGNIMDVKFTRSPMNFIKDGEKYSLKMDSLIKYDIERNGVKAWDSALSHEIVKKMMAKNSIRYVRYSYKRHGGLFNQNPEKANPNLVPRKKGLDPAKYGGYNNTTATYFAIVKCGEPSISFMPVELMFADKFENDKTFAAEYAAKTMSAILSKDINASDVSFPLGRVLKINAMLEIDGCRVNAVSKSNLGRTIGIVTANSLIVDDDTYKYITKISKIIEKSEKFTKFKLSEYDGITAEENLAVFDLICKKCSEKPFKVFFEKMGKKIVSHREDFIALDLEKQLIVLMQMVKLLKTGRSTGCDLKSIGESGQAGIPTINSTLNKIKDLKEVYIIDSSPTGLLEKRSCNLIEL